MDNALYGSPMPQGGAMPQGVPMGGAPAPPPAYGAPPPPMAAAPPPQAPSGPAALPAAMGQAASSMGAPGLAANAMLKRTTVGQNGYGVHPEVSHADIANYLLPKFRNVESSGDYKNYIGKDKGLPQDPKKTASGAYGYINSTWNHHEGYPRAMDAPPEVQDARAHQDLVSALGKFQGDPFKAVANHYYPKYAANPAMWEQPLKDNYGKEIPGAGTVRQYLEKVLPAERVGKYLASVNPQSGGAGSGGM